MKRIILFVVILPFISSCVSVITLSRAPSDLVLVSIQPNNKATVCYYVRSDIVDPFEYKNRGGYRFIFNIEHAFKDNLDAYMTTKFNNIVMTGKDTSKYFLDFILKSFVVEYTLEKSTLDELQNIFGNSGIHGDAIVQVSLNVSLRISLGDSLLSVKNIIASTKSNERINRETSIEKIYSDATNSAISKSIIMADKYLASIGL